MDIVINGKPANITLDTEKNLGDVLAGIEQWISPLGNRIRGISVNGKAISEDALPNAFKLEIGGIEKLDIAVSSWKELAAEALGHLKEICALYENTAFQERANIRSSWEESAAARFIKSDIPDIYNLAALALSGEGLSARDLAVIVEERLRELANTWMEIGLTENPVKNIAKRMEELPLDLQTGKDQRAAETIQLFAGSGEKLFRIFSILKSEGLPLDSLDIDELPVKAFMEGFNDALKELSLAYENRDTVLVGDLAEYELAPRLIKLYSAIKNFSEQSYSLASKP